MQILFVSTWFPYPTDNGSKQRVYHLLRGLAERHAVTLVSLAFGDAKPNSQHLLDTCCERVEVVYQDPFARSRTAQLTRAFRLASLVNSPLPEMQRRVARVNSEEHFDLVIASTVGSAAYVLQQPTPRARILEEHNSGSRMAREAARGEPNVIRRLRREVGWRKVARYEARLYPRFGVCTMVSEQDRLDALAVLNGRRGRIEVIPNGVDCVQLAPLGVPPIPYSLVFAGALTYAANYEAIRWFLTEAYPLIRQRYPRATLTLTGSHHGVDLSRLPLDGSVVLTGRLDDVRPAIRRAEVCVAPILAGGGSRLKVLEAMALGKPLVATSKAVEGLNVQHLRHVLVADTAQATAEAVGRLFDDAQLISQLTAEARRLVEREYDWAGIGRRFCTLAEEIV